MIEVRTNVVRRSKTIPSNNFVGLPPDGNDGDVVTKVSGQAKWIPPAGGGSGIPNTQVFNSPLTSWHVMHNKGVKPLVDVFDVFGNKVFADVRHNSVNDFYVEFSVATAGSVTYF